MNAAQPTMNQLVNLTPHALTLVTAGGTPITFLASSRLARLAVVREARPALAIDGEIYGVVRPTLGEITGLPDPAPGVIYVASALVAEKAGRADVFSPGELIRDAAGVIVGARGLCAYV
jgi:hypothetical protein